MKRCPDTKLEFLSTLCSRGLERQAPWDYFRRIISVRLFPHNRQRQNSLDLSPIVGFGVELGFPSLAGIARIEQPEFVDYKVPRSHVGSAGFIVGRSVQHVDVRFPLEEHGLLVHQRFDGEVGVNRAFREILCADHDGQAVAQDMPSLQLGTQCPQGRRS